MKTILDALQGDAGLDEDIFCHFAKSEGQTAISRGGLRREAARHASLIRRSGVAEGEVVFIILRHSPDLLYSFLGAMMAGAIPSFLPHLTAKQDPGLYWSSHQKLFERTGAGAILTYRGNIDVLRKNIPDLTLRLIDAAESAAAAVDFPMAPAAPEQIALLQHSSGTTSLKKGVALSHQAVLRQISSYARALAIAPQDRVVSWLPLYHDMGLIACFLLPLITRIPVVFLDPFAWALNPKILFDAVREHRGTLCWMPNFAFHHLCHTVPMPGEVDLRSMRAWINCSETCYVETFNLFQRKFAAAGVGMEQLQSCYAMAETVFAVTQTPRGTPPRTTDAGAEGATAGRNASPAAFPRAVLSMGRPIAGLKLRIVDDNRRELPNGRIGEIAISGDCLFDGYFRLPEETQAKLKDGWYHSGDLGFVHEDELYVTGRKNDLIIVHGRNYHAQDLEFVVNGVPGVSRGRNVAVGWFRPELGSEDAVIILERNPKEPGRDLDLAHNVKQAILSQTGLAVCEVYFVPPGWLIKTTSGKISRSENLKKYLASTGRGDAPGPAQTRDATAKFLPELKRIIEMATGFRPENVTRDTRLMDLRGWDSLSQTSILMQIEEAFGVRFPIERVLELNQAGELIDLIAELKPRP